MRRNNEKGILQNKISGVPQGSIVEPTSSNLFFNDFLFNLIAAVHNFADKNNISNIATT